MLKVVERSKIWFSISLVIIAVGLFCMVTKGLNFGIDFKGGTIIEINMGREVTNEDVEKINGIISEYVDVSNTGVRPVNDTNVDISIKEGAIDKDEIAKIHQKVKEEFNLDDNYLVKEDTTGAVIGKELTQKAWIAVILASIAMLIYIAVRFEFKFGAAAVVALVHDILVTLTIYAVFDIRINLPFIAAMLAILGYSINDTIVIFDRIRENKRKYNKKDVNLLVNNSINETLTRSMNTSLSTIITITALFIVVPPIREFTLPLILGIVSGTYSSIFIASPVWVLLNKKFDGKKNKKLKTA